ncbi:MAG: ATP-binding protein [Lewinellaceae bacterium]|nr:ATP-binding protein [Lewinellaceae bacterium]
MKSPFKFLDSYTIQDRDVFFGRKQEIDTLYEMVFQTPLLLVYGLSGTGKTSIIQCGLANRFHGPEWFPFSIRRKENLNTAIHQALEKALKGARPDGSLADKVSYISQKYFRPVYLLFDQFEELFILGSRNEQEDFAAEIKQLLAEELPCKVIFIMREEYLGQLYNFEKAIPTLFDFRLRIEPMSNNKVEEVIASSFEKFNISLEPAPAEERIREIISNISSEKSVIQLPYLQVYLDMLYRDDYKRTYGDKPRNGELPALTFTQEEIRKFGNIKGVLEKFLLEQQEEIQKNLKGTYPGIPKETTRKVLDSLVTEEGTKHPVSIARDEDKNIRITDKKAQITLPALAPQALTD